MGKIRYFEKYKSMLLQIISWILLFICISVYVYILLSMDTTGINGFFKILNVICLSVLFISTIHFFILISTEIIDFNMFVESNISLIEIYFKKVKKEFLFIIFIIIIFISLYFNNLAVYIILTIILLIFSFFRNDTLLIWNYKIYLLILSVLIILGATYSKDTWWIGIKAFLLLYILKIFLVFLFWVPLKLWNISYIRTKKLKEFILYDTIYSMISNILAELKFSNSMSIEKLVKEELIKIKINNKENVIKDIIFLLETSNEIPSQKRNKLLLEFRKKIKDIRFYREKRTEIIKKKNSRNLLFAILMSELSIIVFLGIQNINEFPEIRGTMLLTLTMYIFLAFMTRSYEICKSFYDDIIDRRQKKSNLSKYNRITLAIKSLIEITLFSWCIRIFCIVLSTKGILNINNTFLENYPINFMNISSEKENYEMCNLILELFNSLSISMFNISYELKEWTILGIVMALTHIIQIVTSLVLITLCLTNYFGSKDFAGYYFIVEEKLLIKLKYAIISNEEHIKEKLIEEAVGNTINQQLLELSRKIELKWQKNLIDNEQFNEINDFIEEYISSPADIIVQQRTKK